QDGSSVTSDYELCRVKLGNSVRPTAGEHQHRLLLHRQFEKPILEYAQTHGVPRSWLFFAGEPSALRMAARTTVSACMASFGPPLSEMSSFPSKIHSISRSAASMSSCAS